MARLNEPVGESIESLKRRFVRQNRELARVNSNQSVKIRSLENEISRLLAENYELREHIIQLKGQIEGFGRAQQCLTDVSGVKERLEAKVQEFNALLAELDTAKAKPRRRKSQISSPKRSPIAKNRKPPLVIAEPLDEEGKLPTIVEDKHYPRKTLEPAELQFLVAQDVNDSPDIGPPPKTFLDRETASSTLAQETSEGDKKEDEFSGLLSANFETRRRRRETHVRSHDSGATDFSSSPLKDTPQTKQFDTLSSKPLRAGMKRKIEGVENREPHTVAFKDTENKKDTKTSQNAAAVPSARKVLAPKPVNTDPVVSPRKVNSIESGKQKPDTKDLSNWQSETNHSHPPKEDTSIEILIAEDESLQATEIGLDSMKLEPKTPGLHDILSPGSSHPSDAKPEGRGDTPPPAGLIARVVSGNDVGAEGRGSRRARSNVSYAEPSLNSKMRRPTKDLVDAVTRPERKSTSIPPEEAAKSNDNSSNGEAEKQPSRTIVIKKEEQSAKDWKPSSRNSSQELNRADPQSPLQEKEDIVLNDLPRRARSTIERRRSDLHKSADLGGGDASKSLHTAAQPEGTAKLERAISNLNIFDVKDTPPNIVKQNGGSNLGEHYRSVSTSSLSSRSTSGSISRPPSTGSSSTLSRPGNRRQTLSGVDNTRSSSANMVRESEKRGVRPSRSNFALHDSADSNGATETGPDSRNRRGERAAARRRSMML